MDFVLLVISILLGALSLYLLFAVCMDFTNRIHLVKPYHQLLIGVVVMVSSGYGAYHSYLASGGI